MEENKQPEITENPIPQTQAIPFGVIGVIPEPPSLIAEAPEIDEEVEPEKKHHQYLQDLGSFIDSLSTHKCSECKKVFVYGEWQDMTKNGKKKSLFMATRPSRKGIEHKEHNMLEGDQAPENYFARWDSDKVELENHIKQGKHASEIAEIMGRTPNAINNMIYKCGLREIYIAVQKGSKK